jgi:hypothetical protein
MPLKLLKGLVIVLEDINLGSYINQYLESILFTPFYSFSTFIYSYVSIILYFKFIITEFLNLFTFYSFKHIPKTLNEVVREDQSGITTA